MGPRGPHEFAGSSEQEYGLETGLVAEPKEGSSAQSSPRGSPRPPRFAHLMQVGDGAPQQESQAASRSPFRPPPRQQPSPVHSLSPRPPLYIFATGLHIPAILPAIGPVAHSSLQPPIDYHLSSRPLDMGPSYVHAHTHALAYEDHAIACRSRHSSVVPPSATLGSHCEPWALLPDAMAHAWGWQPLTDDNDEDLTSKVVSIAAAAAAAAAALRSKSDEAAASSPPPLLGDGSHELSDGDGMQPPPSTPEAKSRVNARAAKFAAHIRKAREAKSHASPRGRAPGHDIGHGAVPIENPCGFDCDSAPTLSTAYVWPLPPDVRRVAI